ncbi:MAG: Calx-beta domain-containing protein [bacterium]
MRKCISLLLTTSLIIFSTSNSNASNPRISTNSLLANASNVEKAGLVNITINDVSANESAGSISFTVSLSNVPTANVTVRYSTSSGSAQDGQDFSGKSGTLTIPSGLTSGTISVNLLDDNIDEDSETFTVNLSSPSANAQITDGKGRGTIQDNDSPPTLSINNTSGDENNSTITFTVSLSTVSGKNITVDYTTNDGSATAGNDYTSKSGTLNISAGNSSGSIMVSLIDDALDESDETFTVDLSNPSNATISDAQGRGTIRDDDPRPSLSIDDVTADESDGSMAFTVSLSAVSGKQVKADYTTNDGSATAGSDYTSKSGTLTFSPGTTSQTVTVTINDDSIDEDDETYDVDLSNAQNATISDGQGKGTIIDNDLPSLAISDASGNESGGPLAFTVSLSRANTIPVAVQYSTANGTAMSGDDYTGTSGNLTIPAGATSGTIMISFIDDAVYEDDETFNVNLGNPTNAVLDDSLGIGTIVNDDVPVISIDDVTASENAGTMAFNVTLSMTIPKTVTVDFTTKDSMAIAGDDYTAGSGTLSFSSGTTSQTVTVSVTDDALDEDDEIFTVELSNPTNATLSDSLGVATITDNDSSPALAIDNVSLVEPDSNTATMIFTVSLSAASGREVKVDFATADNSAISPADYVSNSGTLTFLAGSTADTIEVTVNSDSLSELDETFLVDLSNPVNATISDKTGTGTIIGDIILSVALASFEATTGSKGVDLVWQTSTEMDNDGFHLFRSQQQDSGYQQINANLIAGAGTATDPQNYAYTDTNVVTGQKYYYQLGSVHTGGSMYLHTPINITVGPFTGIGGSGEGLPTEFQLSQNYPNPFNPRTVIRFQLPVNSNVALMIYSSSGRLVRKLINREMPAGQHGVVWEAKDDSGARVASGVYVYKLQAGNFTAQRKLLLLK